MISSISCAVHCALMPLLLPLLPLLGIAWLADERVEWLLVGTSALIAWFALGRGYVRHRQLLPSAVVACGLACIVCGRVLHFGGGRFEIACFVVGGAAIATAHRLNHVASCKCACHGK